MKGPVTRPVELIIADQKLKSAIWIRVVQGTTIVLGIAFYPCCPTILRVAWHATHSANISCAGACVPIAKEWFVFHAGHSLVIVGAEAVLKSNMFNIGYAHVGQSRLIVPFEKVKESLAHKENSEVFSHGGLEFACTDWDTPPKGLINSCLVQNNVELNFTGSD